MKIEVIFFRNFQSFSEKDEIKGAIKLYVEKREKIEDLYVGLIGGIYEYSENDVCQLKVMRMFVNFRKKLLLSTILEKGSHVFEFQLQLKPLAGETIYDSLKGELFCVLYFVTVHIGKEHKKSNIEMEKRLKVKTIKDVSHLKKREKFEFSKIRV